MIDYAAVVIMIVAVVALYYLTWSEAHSRGFAKGYKIGYRNGLEALETPSASSAHSCKHNWDLGADGEYVCQKCGAIEHLTIINCYSVGIAPSGLEIRRNHYAKPPSWLPPAPSGEPEP